MPTTAAPPRRSHRSPLFWVGLVILIAFQAALVAHVRGWTRGYPTVNAIAGFIRANMTPLAWCAYLMVAAGALSMLDGRSWLRRYRNRFTVCWLWSVVCWCYFDGMNFYFMRDPHTGLRAWEYHGLPPEFSDRLVGYLIAFGAIAPGMFLSAELLARLGFIRARLGRINGGRMPPLVLAVVAVAGAALCLIPILVGGPASNLALWLGTFCLLDPINAWAGRPSILQDWAAGRWGRTLALGLGGLWCGLLWEFWNYWAEGKWVYHLPFLGRWEHIKYFEMPVPGLVGFIAFGIQTWTMWQTSLLVLSPLVEGERATPDDRALAERLCF